MPRNDGFNMRELQNLYRDIQRVEREALQNTKTFLRKQGNHLNKDVKKLAKNRVGNKGKGPATIKGDKPKTKQYLAGFKRGKPYRYAQSNALSIRVYNTRPHAHLIEYGHLQKTHDKQTPQSGERYVRGKYVLRDAHRAFAHTFYDKAGEFLDDILRRLD